MEAIISHAAGDKRLPHHAEHDRKEQHSEKHKALYISADDGIPLSDIDVGAGYNHPPA